MATLSPYALTTLEEAKAHLNIAAATTTYDDLITRFINAATGRMELYCDRKFIKRSYNEIRDGIAHNRMALYQWPAATPTEVWIDSSSQFTDTEKQLDVDDYVLVAGANGLGSELALLAKCSYNLFPKGVQNVKIVYEAGWDLADLPYELQDACLWIVDYLYDTRSDQAINVTTKGKNQENTTYLGTFPPLITEVLDHYRRAEWPTGSTMFTG